MASPGGFYKPSPKHAPRPLDSSFPDAPCRMKYILVVGGVCSSLGKGVTTSSIGALLRLHGYSVTSIKIDPYINVDAGLMSPYEHGEVYVLSDGGEVDLDLGNYERWMGVKLGRDHNITTGKVYKHLIDTERRGGFLGKTVQVVPHMINEIVERVTRVAERPVDNTVTRPEICLIELGGTVGDLESAPFVEALRQLRYSLAAEDFAVVLCTYLPCMGGTQKTKPTQHSARTLLGLGMIPDFLVCRCEDPLEPGCRAKLSQMCGIREKYVIDAHNVDALYRVPLLFFEQGIVSSLQRKLGLVPKPAPAPTFAPAGMPSMKDLERYCSVLGRGADTPTIRIAFVGKYTQGADTYFSVMQTFEHCCINVGVKIEFCWVASENMEGDSPGAQAARDALRKMDGIFVAGGFGIRGVEGKVIAARIAREANVPYLGVCLGMQVALIDLARSVAGIEDATSEEFDNFNDPVNKPKSKNHVVVQMLEKDPDIPGMSRMRLGAREVYITAKDSKLRHVYGGADKVWERHRHRFEFNMKYFEELKAKGVSFVASDDPNFGPETRIEGIEWPKARFFVAVQYHPEYVTAASDPSPPYLAFVAAAANKAYDFPQGKQSRAVLAEAITKTPAITPSMATGLPDSPIAALPPAAHAVHSDPSRRTPSTPSGTP